LILSDTDLFEVLCALIVLLASAYALIGLLRLLKRRHEGLAIDRPILVAFSLRLLAAVALGQLAIARDLRGGDEVTFLTRADHIATTPFTGGESMDALTTEFHTFLFSLHFRALGTAPPDFLLRIEMVLFSVIGIALLAAAVHELAGARASTITAWLLALEPANIFFSSLLHKEPIMYLAEGMVVYGGTMLWKRDRLTALVPIVVGCALAMATRPYVGWFLSAAAAAGVLHASLRQRKRMRSLVLAAGVIVLVAAFIPTVWNASSDQNLQELQQSQDANATDQSNLSLERVDYSTRSNLVLNLPKRIRDVVLRPYIWQTQNASQQLGAIGTLVVLACLGVLAAALIRNRRGVMQTAGPLVYPAAFMLVAYAISAGNAGTAYRYRTHLVALAICLAIVLLAHRRQEQEGPARVPAKRPGLGPVSRTRTAT